MPPTRLLAVLAAFLVLPAAAHAAVTTSQVTSPADPYFALDDDDATTGPTVTVSGTSNGTTGDTVDVVCNYDGGSISTLMAGVAVAADGTFTATGELESIDGNTCILRAIPPGTSSDSYNRFRGPRAAVSSTRVAGKVPDIEANGGTVFDFETIAEGLGGFFDLDSATNRGIDDSSPYSRSIFEEYDDVFDDAGALTEIDEGGSGIRSQILIDGHNAFGSHSAATLFAGGALDSENAPGLPALTYTTALDPVTGILTITESQALVRCPGDTLPANDVNCPSFTGTGVRLERTWTIGRDGRQAAVVDVFRSTDGAAHAIDLLYDMRTDSSERGFLVPPSDEFERWGDGGLRTAAQMGPGPLSIFGKETDDEPTDSPEGGIAAFTFAEAPDEIRFVAEEQFEAQFKRTVPAGGTATLRTTFGQGPNIANVMAAARAAEDRFSPPSVSFTGPANGAVVSGAQVAVTGRASDNVGVASLTVNGNPAVVFADGTWIAELRLTPGANTIIAVARDRAGNEATATLAITYRPLATTKPTPSAVTAKLTPTRDTRAPFRFTISGKLVLPAGVSVAQGCGTGTVLVQTKAASRTISARQPPLRADCSFRETVSFRSRRSFGRSRRTLKVNARFTGNLALEALAIASPLNFRVR